MKLKILTFPHKRLLTPCEEVTFFDDELLSVLDSMWETMKDAKGLGIAANQCGISLDMCIIDGPNGRVNLINPYIAASSAAPANLKEACLSAPRESIVVPGRSQWVQVRYQNEKGEHKSIVFKDIYAVCASHEIDHLDGKSFFEHPSLPRTTRKKLSKKWGVK